MADVRCPLETDREVTATDQVAMREGKPMINVRVISRLGMLAVGLAIGAAAGSTPGLASADSSSDPYSWLAGLDLSDPASSTSGLNFAISIDGYSLIQDGSAYADSTSGNIAIAYGNDSIAASLGGYGDVAEASGTNAYAISGGSSGSNFDTAIDIGNNSDPGAASPDGAFANAGYPPGSDDTAIVVGNNGLAYSSIGNNDLASVVGNNSSAYAGGDLADGTATGDNDVATVFDPFGTVGSVANAGATQGVDGVSGNSDIASVLFSDAATANALGANDLYDIFSALGNESGTAAATSGASLVTDLMSLF
jgi:hypothetical protein